MSFTSLEFLVLLGVTITLFYLVKQKSIQVLILVLGSVGFYLNRYPSYTILLLSLALIDATVTYLIQKNQLFSVKRFISISGVAINLGILIFFKYSYFFSKTFIEEDSSIGEYLLMIPVPLGISFFTFHGIGMIIDTFKMSADSKAPFVHDSLHEHFLNTSLLITFFAHITSGPISRAKDFIGQVEKKSFKNIDWQYCFESLVIGFFLKIVVADNLADQTYWMQYPYFLYRNTIELVMMLFGYSIQIFADFAGYSLIAIGIAGLFQYKLPQNFRYPYISDSFTDFWKRWHITLSFWFRDYLFLPLAFNLAHAFKKDRYFNIKTERIVYTLAALITFGLCGLWHGAAWGFVLWGLYHGMGLAIEHATDKKKKRKKSANKRIIKRLFIFLMITFGWLLFRLENFSYVIEYIKGIADLKINFSAFSFMLLVLYSLPVIIYHIISLYRDELGTQRIQAIKPYIYGCLVFLILVNKGYSTGFIYFQF